MQLDYNDYTILQAASGLDSRKEINLEYLPLFTAPMDTVINEKNYTKFAEKGIGICFPRKSKVSLNYEHFVSYGLDEFVELVDGEILKNEPFKILVDVANGNMPRLREYLKKCKEKYPSVILMAGNVGSDRAFLKLSETGVDYIRCGIGAGSGCLTSVQTGVGQGMATLILDCLNIKRKYSKYTNVKIVADGGIQSYRDIIIALALGADYVMMGGVFNKCLESAAEKELLIPYALKASLQSKTWVNSNEGYLSPISIENFEKLLKDNNYTLDGVDLKQKYSIESFLKGGFITAKYRGMSTKSVQKEWGKETLTTSEGIEKTNIVEYTLDSWLENFLDYLKSAMAYTGSSKLSSFIGYTNTTPISTNSYNRFKK